MAATETPKTPQAVVRATSPLRLTPTQLQRIALNMHTTLSRAQDKIVLSGLLPAHSLAPGRAPEEGLGGSPRKFARGRSPPGK
jgi:hypothetical protein